MNIIDKNIINEYSIKNIDYTSFADISAMNDPLSTTSEYYLPFLMLLERWRAMTTPPNWEYPDFIKALEKRNIDLSNTEKETLKFVFGEIQTPPDNVERTIESFNKKSEKEQISMRERNSEHSGNKHTKPISDHLPISLASLSIPARSSGLYTPSTGN